MTEASERGIPRSRKCGLRVGEGAEAEGRSCVQGFHALNNAIKWY